MTDIAALETELLGTIQAADDEEALEAARVAALGKKGSISALLATLGKMPPEERRTKGPLINGLKDRVTQAVARRRETLKEAHLAQRLKTETIDITLPTREDPAESGRTHPISQVIDELTAIYSAMGFAIAEGPDIETDEYNFTKLNFPEGHPAREMHDTFFFNPKPDGSRLLLRTHTSPVQVRGLETLGPPLKMIAPGRVFRNEEVDPSHEHTFYQLEGMMVDHDVSVAHLIYFMKTLLSAIFKREVTVRLRPGFFPFVEPGFELDIQCLICNGAGCPVCKQSGWVELLPCGLVHPAVLRYGGADPEQWSGFAFGLGLTRLAMMRYGVDDIRLMMSGDLRFLRQF